MSDKMFVFFKDRARIIVLPHVHYKDAILPHAIKSTFKCLLFV